MWCGRSRVRFALTPTGLTDPLSWKESLSATHLNFTRPEPQPQWIGGWRGGLWDGVREREWELQGVVTEVKLLKWVKGMEDRRQFQLAILLNVTEVFPWNNLDYKRDWTSLNGQLKINYIWWILSTRSWINVTICIDFLLYLLDNSIQYAFTQDYGASKKNCEALISINSATLYSRGPYIKMNAIAYMK